MCGVTKTLSDINSSEQKEWRHSPALSAPNQLCLCCPCISHVPFARSQAVQQCHYQLLVFLNAQLCGPAHFTNPCHLPILLSTPICSFSSYPTFFPFSSRCPPFPHPATLSTAVLSIFLPDAVMRCHVLPCACLCVIVHICVSSCVTGSCRKLG